MNTLLVSILEFILIVVNLYMWVVIIAALITWVQPNPYNPIVRFLWNVTEPVYAYIRRFIPTNFGGFDVAPLILLLLLQFIQLFFVNLLFRLANSLW